MRRLSVVGESSGELHARHRVYSVELACKLGVEQDPFVLGCYLPRPQDIPKYLVGRTDGEKLLGRAQNYSSRRLRLQQFLLE